MKKVRIDQHLHALIIKKRNLGMSQRKIAEDLNISKSAVDRHIKLARPFHQKNCLQRGGQRKTNRATDRRIVLTSKRDRFTTNSLIASQFNVSRDTIRRRLRNAGIISRVAKKDPLTLAQKVLRYNWSRRHRQTNFNYWLFSDESSFELADLCAPKRQYVHRRNGEANLDCCVQPANVKDRRSLMVWGVISREGRVCLAFVHGVIDRWQYIQLLQQYLLPYLDNLPLNTLAQTIYQDDNARPHRAIVVQNFCMHNGIQRPIWPAYSPDLNPIENVWAEMKKFVAARHPRTLQDLRRLILAAWERVITPDFCRRLYDGLPGRIRRVIGKRGRR